MPITQSRMIALIIAARDFQDALQASRRAIMVEKARAISPETEEVLGRLLFNTDPLGILRDPIQSNLILDREEGHFNRMEKSNIAAAAKAAEKRGAPKPGQSPREQKLGPKPRAQVSHSYRTTAPDSPLRRANIHGSIQEVIQAEASGIKSQRAPIVAQIPGLYDTEDDDLGTASLSVETKLPSNQLSANVKADIDAIIEEERRLRELGIPPKE